MNTISKDSPSPLLSPLSSPRAQASPTTVTRTPSLESAFDKVEAVLPTDSAKELKSILKQKSSYTNLGKITESNGRSLRFNHYSHTNDGEVFPTKDDLDSQGPLTKRNREFQTSEEVSKDQTCGRSRSSSSGAPEPYRSTLFSSENDELEKPVDLSEATLAVARAGRALAGGVTEAYQTLREAAQKTSQTLSTSSKSASKVAHRYIGEPLGGIAKDLYEGKKPLEEVFIPSPVENESDATPTQN